jgi:CheY-like chemotaxis protein
MADTPSPPRRLLLVEDELGVRRYVETVLVRAGWVVEPAVTGVQALEKLKTTRYAAVILDLALPWMTGFEVLAAMRDDPETADVPVVVITGSSVADAQFERYAPVTLLRKPFEAARLLAAVEECR